MSSGLHEQSFASLAWLESAATTSMIDSAAMKGSLCMVLISKVVLFSGARLLISNSNKLEVWEVTMNRAGPFSYHLRLAHPVNGTWPVFDANLPKCSESRCDGAKSTNRRNCIQFSGRRIGKVSGVWNSIDRILSG
jgi:hypothetical protein